MAVAIATETANKKTELASSESDTPSERKTLVSREGNPLKINSDSYPKAIEIWIAAKIIADYHA